MGETGGEVDRSTANTERDAGGLVWQVDGSDTTDCIECDERAVQIMELDADRYLCPGCGLVWNPHQVDKHTDRSGVPNE